VAFLDVADSTRLADRLGDARWAARLGRLYGAAREAVARHGGAVVVTTGDGLLATFPLPGNAVRYGCAAVDAVAGFGLVARAGVHATEVERVGGDIAGVGVHIGARVAGLARPGEVWVTRTVRDLVIGSDLRFEARGAHALKGLAERWELHAAVGGSMELASGSPSAGSQPAPSTPTRR
jgi:class 3 adenylate cyclase